MKGGETTRKLFICLVSAIVMIISMFPVGNAFAALTNWNGILDQSYIKGNVGASPLWYDNDDTTFAKMNYGSWTSSIAIEVDEVRIVSNKPVQIRLAEQGSYSKPPLYQFTTVGTGQLETFKFAPVKGILFIDLTGTDVTLYEVEFYSASPPDTTPPAVPTGLSGKAVGDDIVLNWLPNTESDFDKYIVYRDGNKILETKDRTVTISGLAKGVDYKFQLSAVDTSGNVSARSPAVTVQIPPPPPPDTTPPAAPIGLKGKGNDKQAILDWTANTESDLAGYIVYQDGKEIHRTTSNSVTVNNLTNGQSYSFAVAAYDTSGNISAKSNSVTVVPSDKIDVNLIPNMDSIIVQVISGTQPFQIDWGSGNDTFNSTQYVITGLQANTDYTVTITDDQGRVWSATINTGDKKGFIPPSFPNPQELFQKMLDMFGTAGTIAVAIIGGAILLGILCVLAMWAWRLLKNWLHRSK